METCVIILVFGKEVVRRTKSEIQGDQKGGREERYCTIPTKSAQETLEPR